MISIITPTYNEKENVSLFIKKVSSFLTRMKLPFEIIVVDDNSPDGTGEVVRSLKSKYPQVSLIKRINKNGIGSAYFDGFSKARGDILIGIDADLSPSLSAIPLFIEKLKKGTDMVIGSRYIHGSKVRNISIFRQFGSKFFNVMLQLVFNSQISDITHSYRALKKNVFKNIARHITESGHPSFFIELTFWTIRKEYVVGEVPITFVERRHGYSKLNTFQGLKNAIKTIKRLKKIHAQ